jgi:hypothetical protein
MSVICLLCSWEAFVGYVVAAVIAVIWEQNRK